MPAQRRCGASLPGKPGREASSGMTPGWMCCATLLLPIRQTPTPSPPRGAAWNGTSNGSSYLHQPVRPGRLCPGGCETLMAGVKVRPGLTPLIRLSPVSAPTLLSQVPVFGECRRIAPHMPVSTPACLAPLMRIGKRHASGARRGGGGAPRCPLRTAPCLLNLVGSRDRFAQEAGRGAGANG